MNNLFNIIGNVINSTTGQSNSQNKINLNVSTQEVMEDPNKRLKWLTEEKTLLDEIIEMTILR